MKNQKCRSASLRMFACIAALGLGAMPWPEARAHGAAHPEKVSLLPVALLGLGDSTFWDGGTILTTQVPDPDLCDVAGPCPTFALSLAPGGRRLRVGIDTPERSDTFVIELIDPEGRIAVSESNANQFNSEAMVLDPEPGDWTIRIRPQDVTHATFRMRAKLEDVLPEDLMRQRGHEALLPNLRTVPPYEFTFIAPANPLNGVYPPDTVNPPLAAGDVHPVSCTADEAAPVAAGGAAAVRCLRFTSGPMNLGPGIYDMRFNLIDDFIAGTAALNPEEALSRIVVGPMLQVIHFADGTTQTIPAGTYSFHPVHAHFHDDYVLNFELYAVTDTATGAMTRVGTGTKSGFCPADQLFADWRAFDQGYEVPGGDTAFGSCFSPDDGVIGLSIGWGDVYRWQRPGMYVEFDGLGNGRYVVHSIVDGNNHVLETDDHDNRSYAYIEVDGEDIQLLERGWGVSPWDPKKVVFSGPGPAQDRVAGNTPGTVAAPAGGGALGWASLALLLLCGSGRRFARECGSPRERRCAG